MKRTLFFVLFSLVSFGLSCNFTPAIKFPKSVGSFQLKKTDVFKGENGRQVVSAQYISTDNKIIACHGFDSTSEEVAYAFVNALNAFGENKQQAETVKDKNGQTIGFRNLAPSQANIHPGSSVMNLRWNRGLKTYDCFIEDETNAAKQILEEFEKSWQNQGLND